MYGTQRSRLGVTRAIDGKMVVEDESLFNRNERKQTSSNDLNGRNRRRSVMDIKFSFRRKKKSRMDCDGDATGDSSNLNRRRRHKIRGKQIDNEEITSSSPSDRPRSIFSKIFSFRRDRRRPDHSYNASFTGASKSVDCLASDQPCDESYRENELSTQTKKPIGKASESGNQCSVNLSCADMSVSVSSPNLSTAKWSLFEFFDETGSREKYASFRRSRASMVFPILENVENDLSCLHSSNSERQLHQATHLRVNNVIFDNSCLPCNGDKRLCDQADSVCSRNRQNDEHVTRTNDGRSPHPRRHNPVHETFSSPDTLGQRLGHTRVYQFASAESIKETEQINGSLEGRKSNPSGSGVSRATTRNAFEKGSRGDDDFVFVTIDSHVGMPTQSKTLSRYISCPGNLETEARRRQLTSSLPSSGFNTKPYSSHHRPYSVHESVLSLNLLETNDAGIDEELDEKEVSDSYFPPDDDLSLPSKELPLGLAEALWDHAGKLKTELSFRAGETITVYFINKLNWWWGTIEERKGWFPSSHVRLRIDQKLSDSEVHTWNVSKTMSDASPGRHNAFSLLGMQATLCTENEVRSKCILELLTSEQDYLKTLRDVIEGYLNRARRKTEMFSADDISVIFGNIERIYKFHRKFYRELKEETAKDSMFNSQVGKLFIAHRAEFEIYSEYCNNHPEACAKLLALQKEKKFKLFFESCRLLQKMISLSVDAFLLTPVQKICKYPLQLKELLKHTPQEHPDHDQLQIAAQVMKDVASSINENKRKFENLNGIAEWQLNVDSWQGGDVLELSSEMIRAGCVDSLFGGKKAKIQMHLFDHQMIICKMDSLKKPAKLVYENRINLDNARIDTVFDPTDEDADNLIRVTDFGENLTYWISTRNPEEMEQWRMAFKRERETVAAESKTGFTVPLSMRRAAMQSAKAKKQSEHKKGPRRRKSLTDPFQDFGSNVIRRSLRLRRTQSLREKKHIKSTS